MCGVGENIIKTMSAEKEKERILENLMVFYKIAIIGRNYREEQFDNIVETLNKDSVPGWDGITMNDLKTLNTYTLLILTTLKNEVFNTGFPRTFKTR